MNTAPLTVPAFISGMLPAPLEPQLCSPWPTVLQCYEPDSKFCLRGESPQCWAGLFESQTACTSAEIWNSSDFFTLWITITAGAVNDKIRWFRRSETLDLLLLIQFLKWALILIHRLSAPSGICFIKLSHRLLFFLLVGMLSCALLSRIVTGLCGWGEGKGNLTADTPRASCSYTWPKSLLLVSKLSSQWCAAWRPQESSLPIGWRLEVSCCWGQCAVSLCYTLLMWSSLL